MSGTNRESRSSGEICSHRRLFARARRQGLVWSAGLKAKKMTGGGQRQRNWTPEEDGRLLELVEAGKSWVFIAANLNRPLKSVHVRARLLEAKVAMESHLPRFLVRQGTAGFMVWDRRTKAPATLYGQLTTGLTEEEAHKFKDILTERYIAEK